MRGVSKDVVVRMVPEMRRQLAGLPVGVGAELNRVRWPDPLVNFPNRQ